MSFKNLEGQANRWIQHLQEYNFSYEHCLGWKQNNNDVLSCRLCQEECTHRQKSEALADIKKIQSTVAIATDGQGCKWPKPLMAETQVP
jgi:hypothetical protein